jgi:tetrahydromethanopterin S-methyltransferase subunit G
MTEEIRESRKAAWEARLDEIEADIDWHNREVARHRKRLDELNQRYSRICDQGPLS